MTINFNAPIGIKNAIFINPHDPIMWELDEIKFSKTYPDLFANFLNALSEQPDSDPSASCLFLRMWSGCIPVSAMPIHH